MHYLTKHSFHLGFSRLREQLSASEPRDKPQATLNSKSISAHLSLAAHQFVTLWDLGQILLGGQGCQICNHPRGRKTAAIAIVCSDIFFVFLKIKLA